MLNEKFQAARARLVHTRPYLATAIYAMVPVEKPGLGTMAVDEFWRIYYDPAIFEQWSVEEIAGVIYHEILHLVRIHPERLRSYEKNIANIAADLEINDDVEADLRSTDLKLPQGVLLPKTFDLPDRLLAEEYYELLLKNTVKIKGLTLSGPGMGRCGSCATGQSEDWELPELHSERSVGQAEGEIIRRDMAQQIVASAGQGNVPEHLARWAKEKLTPKIDWRKELASVMRNAVASASGSVDYSFSRPSRRQGQHKIGDIILPAMIRPVPEVAVVVDTSGSINDQTLAMAITEVSGILKKGGLKQGLTVLAVDAAVHSCKRIFDPRQVLLAGGGGTNMGIGIEAATKLRPRPQVIVVITDGHTGWPVVPPPAKTIIVLIGNGPKGPDWAKTIKIEGDG